MRIRTQLIVGLAVSAVLAVAMLVSVTLRIKSQTELLAAFDRTQATVQACSNLLALTQEFAFYGEPRAAQQWRKRFAEIKRNASEEIALPRFHSQNLASIKANVEHLDELFNALETMSTAPVNPLTPMRKQLIVDQLVTNTTNVADDAYQLALEVNDESRQATQLFLTIFVLIAIAFVMIIVYFSFIITRRILLPLARLEEAANAVRNGDLSVRNNSSIKDELGDLGREFDEMTDSLQKRSLSLVMVNADLAQQVALRTQTEQRVRLITDNLPALIAYITTDGVYSFVNRQFDKMLGLDSSTMVGKHVREVLGEKNFENLRPRAAAVFSGKPVTFEVRLDTPKATRDFRANYLPDFDKLGNIVGFFVMHEDITERKAIDAQLHILNNRFLLATKAGGIGVWEWHVASNRMSADARMHELYQVEHNDASDNLYAWSARIHPQDIARVKSELGEVVQNGTPYASEFRLLLPDRSIRIIRGNGVLSGSRTDGSLSLIGVNWDVTDLRRAERAQRDSEERFRLFVENVQGYSIIMLDPKGNIENWNLSAQQMQGYTAKEIIGNNFAVFQMAVAVSADHPAMMLKTAERAGRFHEEGWHLRKDGSKFFSEMAITALRDEAGALRGFGMVTRDLTAQKQKEAAISEALQEKETLLKEVYHRVKNNLQVITSLLKLQARTLGPGPAFEALSESVGRVRAMSIVHEKLYQSGTLSSISVKDYIDDLCRDLATTTGASDRGVVISCAIAPIQLGLETAVPLGLLLNELVSNCLKHAFVEGRTGGAVKISMARDGVSHAVLKVADNGIGMDAGFDIQLANSLGLKLATTLTAQLDGDIDIVNDGGMLVVIRFPIPDIDDSLGDGQIGQVAYRDASIPTSISAASHSTDEQFL